MNDSDINIPLGLNGDVQSRDLKRGRFSFRVAKQRERGRGKKDVRANEPSPFSHRLSACAYLSNLLFSYITVSSLNFQGIAATEPLLAYGLGATRMIEAVTPYRES